MEKKILLRYWGPTTVIVGRRRLLIYKVKKLPSRVCYSFISPSNSSLSLSLAFWISLIINKCMQLDRIISQISLPYPYFIAQKHFFYVSLASSIIWSVLAIRNVPRHSILGCSRENPPRCHLDMAWHGFMVNKWIIDKVFLTLLSTNSVDVLIQSSSFQYVPWDAEPYLTMELRK